MLLQGFARRALYGYAPPYACRMAVTSLADALAVTASGTVDVVDGVLQLNEEPPPELVPRVDVRKWLGPPGSRPPRRPRSSLAPPADGDYSDDDDLGVIFAREARPPPGDSGRDLLREKIDGLVGAEPEAVAAAPEVPAAPEEEPEDEAPALARGLRSLAGGAGVFADSRSGFAYPADYAVGPPVDGSTHNLGDLEAAGLSERLETFDLEAMATNQWGRPSGFDGLVVEGPRGVPCLVGRKSFSDETLRKVSRGADLWFQAVEGRGSRVLLRTSCVPSLSKSPRECMEFAADLAAHFGGGARGGDDAVEVMYTDSRRVAKRGSRVGQLKPKKRLGTVWARPDRVADAAREAQEDQGFL